MTHDGKADEKDGLNGRETYDLRDDESHVVLGRKDLGRNGREEIWREERRREERWREEIRG